MHGTPLTTTPLEWRPHKPAPMWWGQKATTARLTSCRSSSNSSSRSSSRANCSSCSRSSKSSTTSSSSYCSINSSRWRFHSFTSSMLLFFFFVLSTFAEMMWWFDQSNIQIQHFLLQRRNKMIPWRHIVTFTGSKWDAIEKKISVYVCLYGVWDVWFACWNLALPTQEKEKKYLLCLNIAFVV